jgi:ketosteroid isomerase-like protein
MSPLEDFRALLEAILAAINTRDYDALPDLLEPDQEFHSMMAATEGGIYAGIEGMHRFLADVEEIWADFRTDLLDFRLISDDVAIAAVRNSGMARISGVPLDTGRWCVITRRNGRAWRNIIYATPEEAERAVGLDP